MITDKFIHIHIPRTGGTSLRVFLSQDLKNNIHVIDRQFHLSLDKSTEVFERKTNSSIVPDSFAFVRNPWDWYVSAYHFLMTNGHLKTANNTSTKDSPLGTFETFITNIYKRTKGTIPFQDYPLRLWLRRFDNYSDSFYSLTQDEVDYIGRFENLIPDLTDILINKLEVPDLTPEKIIDGMTNKKAHKTKHAPYQDLYNDSMVNMVGEIDKKLIDQFNYMFK
jgi:hypothetical protein